jgi:Replication protein P
MKTLDQVLKQVRTTDLSHAGSKTNSKHGTKAGTKKMMHESESLLEQTDSALHSARKNSASSGSNRDHVDVINQIFAEFELAYHNQFHKAYAQEGSLNLAKKYWLNCLSEFIPEVILRAARQVVKSQEYLPTVSSMIKACENTLPLFGLPTPQAAYIEACCALEPKHANNWSHPAVYLAAKATSWFALANETQATIFPAFEYNYHLLCQQVMRGEVLAINLPVALPATIAAPLSAAENKARMKKFRAKYGL